jgi:hypothetical protein
MQYFGFIRPAALGALLFLVASASAQTDRVVFNFTGADPARSLPWTATSVLESGLTTQGWTMGSGLSLVSARSNRIAFAGTAGEQLSTLEEARNAGAYLNVRFASLSGPLQLGSNRIRFTIRRESWHAPLRFAVYSSTDNFASPVFVSEEVEQMDDGTHNFSFLLPSAGFANLSGAVDFRIYPFAARSPLFRSARRCRLTPLPPQPRKAARCRFRPSAASSRRDKPCNSRRAPTPATPSPDGPAMPAARPIL